MYINMYILTIEEKQHNNEYGTKKYLYFLKEINAIIRMKELYIREYNDKCDSYLTTLSFNEIEKMFDNEENACFHVDDDYYYHIEITKIKYEDL